MRFRIILLFVLLLSILLLVPSASASWANSSFQNRQPIFINNTGNATTLTYFPVYLNISWNSSMNVDFSDLRVINETSGLFVPYYFQNIINSSYVNLWFNATSIPASSWDNTTYYLYYNNSTAISTSDGNTTFEFFDNFNRANSGTVGNGWSESVNANGEISSNQLKIGLDTKVYRTYDLSNKIINVKTSFNLQDANSRQVRFCGVGSVLYQTGLCGVMASDTDAGQSSVKIYDNEVTKATSATNFVTNQIYSVEFAMLNNYSTSLKVWANNTPRPDGVNISAISLIPADSSQNMGIATSTQAGSTHFFDDFFIRKYVSVEPIIQLGQIQTIPTNIIPIIASNNVKYSNNTGNTTGALIYTKLREITITENYTGSWKISYLTHSGSGDDSYTRIYKNDIAFGTENINVAGSLGNDITYSQTFSGYIDNSDRFSVYGHVTTGGFIVFASTFRILFDYDYANATPTLTYPTNTSTISFNYPPQFTDVNFTWNTIALSGYNMLIAKDINFNVITDNSTTPNSYISHSLEASTYYWKVRTYNDGGATIGNWSNTFSFTLFPMTATTVNNSSQGIVYQLLNGNPSTISGVKVELYNATYYTYQVTGDNGYYLFTNLVVGQTYSLKASKLEDFDDSPVIPVTILANSTVTNNILMQKCTSVFTCFYNKQWVTFAVQDIYFNRYANITITTYIDGNLNPDDIEVTDTNGKGTFLMVKNTQYRIEAINSVLGINQVMFIIPGDPYYVIIVNPALASFSTPNNENDLIMVTPSSKVINATHAYMNVTYTNASGISHTVNATLMIINGDTTRTILGNQSVSSANNTFSFIVSGYAGNSYIIKLEVFGSPLQHFWQYAFKFPGIKANPYSSSDTFLGILSVIIILFFATLFDEKTVGIGGLIVSGITGILYDMGFMNAPFFGAILFDGTYYSVIPFAVGLTMLMSILYIINQRNAKEGFS